MPLYKVDLEECRYTTVTVEAEGEREASRKADEVKADWSPAHVTTLDVREVRPSQDERKTFTEEDIAG